MFLEILQNSYENTCVRVSFLIKKLKKETLVQVFSSEFCEISTEHLQTISSEFINNYLQISDFLDSVTGAFLWIFRNFSEHLFLQNIPGGCFWQFLSQLSNVCRSHALLFCLRLAARLLFILLLFKSSSSGSFEIL